MTEREIIESAIAQAEAAIDCLDYEGGPTWRWKDILATLLRAREIPE